MHRELGKRPPREQLQADIEEWQTRLENARTQYENSGGQGSVEELLLKGADDDKWKQMSSSEQELYERLIIDNKLHL